MSNEEQDLIIEQQEDTVSLILNRPTARNALNKTLIEKMIAQLEKISTDDSVRMVIISGAGEHFCAGADLKWMLESVNYDEQQNLDDAKILAKFMRTLNTLNKPTICITQGAVYGGALGIVACCDIVMALKNSIFCASEVRLGLAPAVISPYLIDAMGARAARRFFLTAEIIDATQAERLGLVHVVVADAIEMSSQLDRFVHLISQAAPNAVAATKALILNNLDCNHPDVDSINTKLIAKLRVSPEGQEGLKAFFEKRSAKW